MSDYPDQPYYYQAVVPTTVRLAEGTEFGAVAWSGTLTAGETKLITYQIPNNGYNYVLDKVFVYTTIVGLVPMSIVVCSDFAYHTWIALASKEAEGCSEFNPFSFVSMTVRSPQGLGWYVINQNNISRSVSLFATMYRYLSSV